MIKVQWLIGACPNVFCSVLFYCILLHSFVICSILLSSLVFYTVPLIWPYPQMIVILLL